MYWGKRVKRHIASQLNVWDPFTGDNKMSYLSGWHLNFSGGAFEPSNCIIHVLLDALLTMAWVVWNFGCGIRGMSKGLYW